MMGLGSTGRALALAALFGMLAGCAGKPFNVKTVPTVAPERLGPEARSGALGLHASAEWDEDWLLETYDANLILAGVLPVRVDIENAGAAPVATRKLSIELADASGNRFKRLDPKKAMKRIEGYYEVTVMNRSGRDLYRADFLSNALALSEPLGPGEHRQGFLFFEIPKGVNGRVSTSLVVASKTDSVRVELK